MRDMVQVYNPKVQRYVKIDRGLGRPYPPKKTKGPYKSIPIVSSPHKMTSDKGVTSHT